MSDTTQTLAAPLLRSKLIRHLGRVTLESAARVGLLKASWRLIDGDWYWIDFEDVDGRHLAFDRACYARIIHAVVANLAPGGTFLDVGANLGRIAFAAARRVGPTGRVLAFEANPTIAARLNDEIARNHTPQVEVVPVACGAIPGELEFYVSRAHTGRSSLSQLNAQSSASIRVPCERVDTLLAARGIAHADVVKIDVEGAEMLVLQGMEKLLAGSRPVLIVETDPELLASFSTSILSITTYLGSFGYEPEPVDSTNLLFRAPQNR